MPDLNVTAIPQEELDALAARGARHGRTAEEEARHLIHEAAAEQILLAELERATREVEARQREVAGPAAADTGIPQPRRRYGRYEPTPRRR